MDRRSFVVTGLATLAGSPSAFALAGKRPFSLGYSTYAMKTFDPVEAIREIAKAGFEALEICLLPGWPTEPAKMNPAQRKAVLEAIKASKLRPTALMEHLVPHADAKQAKTLEQRVLLACELAREINPQKPPLIQTVLGGGDFDKLRTLNESALKSWARIAGEYKVVLAIKPHRFGAMSLPLQAISLIEAVGSPWLKMVYDPSHLVYRGLDIQAELKKSKPYLSHVAIKDAFEKDGKVQFDYPGATGKMDYASLFQSLTKMEYSGDVNCEISSMISNKPGYNALAVMKASFAALSRFLA